MRAIVPKLTARQVLFHLPRLSDCKLTDSRPPDENPVALKILTDQAKLAAENIHPFEVIVAMRRFEVGNFQPQKIRRDEPNVKKHTRIRPLATPSWEVKAEVVTACCLCYGITMKLIPPMDLSLLIAVDPAPRMKETPISGLMGMHAADVAASMITCYKNAAKDKCKVVAFSRKSSPGHENDREYAVESSIVDVDVKLADTPTDVMKRLDPVLSGPVDISALLNHAVANKLKVDAILVFAGHLSVQTSSSEPRQAFANYRDAVNPKAKLVVVGAASRKLCTASPDDEDHLDIVGFGVTVPRQIEHFLTS